MVNDKREYPRHPVKGKYFNGNEIVTGLISVSFKGLSIYLDEDMVRRTAIGMIIPNYYIEIYGFSWELPVRVVRKIDQNRLALEIMVDKFEHREDWLRFLSYYKLID